MILIAGIQPKTTVVDPAARRCPTCGLHQAHLKRVDHYLSLFFLPVLRVRKGEEILVCDRCAGPVEPGSPRSGGLPSESKAPAVCRQCGGPLEKEFSYCPHCGQRQ